jgi:hypothetical protein
MTVVAWGLLLVVMAAQTFLALLLVRENRRLTQHAGVHERLVALNASVVGLRKEHQSLEELVLTWRARDAVRAGRKKKEKEEEPEPDELSSQDSIFFPSDSLS